MYRRIKKYFKPICFISFVPFATPLINSATNTSLNIAITSKVDINTIFGDTVNMSCVQTPTADDILSYLGNIGIQQGYPNVMNQLMISN
jgi:hypothetical protein